MAYAEDIAKSVSDEYRELSGSRTTFEAHWEDVARLVLPSYAGMFTANSMQTPGAKRTQYQFDSTAASACTKFASVMESLLTPRNSRWHRVMPSDQYLLKDRETRLWFEAVTDILFRFRQAPQANFQGQNQQSYLSLGAFGTGPLFIDAYNRSGLRYRAIHLGEIYFAENHQGIIDKALRRFEMTARQIVQKWPDTASQRVKEAADKTPERKYWVLHCVKPRADYDPNRMDGKGRPFASYYVEDESKTLLAEGGYGSFPYAVGRYLQAPGEIYGRSPAMECLPAIKTLNEQKKTMLKQGHRVVDPVLLAHDDGVLGSFKLRPGYVNPGTMTQDGKRLVDVLPTGNLAAGEKMMEYEIRAINDAFLVTLFQILTESPQMTATEVLERTREKGMLLAPTMGRQMSEYLGPMIEREIDVLRDLRLLPPMPPALVEAQGEYRIEYDSPMSRAQKAEEGAGLMRTVQMTLEVVNVTQNPEPLDHFNWDEIVPAVAEMQAVPTKWLRSLDDVQKIRAGRQQMAEQQMAVDAAPAMASVAKVAASQPGA